MKELFVKTRGVIIPVICALMVIALAFDDGKYAGRIYADVDYSKFIEESSEEIDVFEEVSLSENEKLLRYIPNDKNMGRVIGNVSQALYEGEKASSVTAVANLNYRFLQWNDGVTTETRTDVASESKTYVAQFEYIGFPQIYINVADVKGEITKEYSSAAISSSNAAEEYTFENKTAKIKVRGNSSSRLEKKSYRIKFSEKRNLFGIGKAARKDWVLVANHGDQSLMRNYIAYNMAKSFSGFEVSYNCAFVEVYLNGEYNGVYLLTEQVEVADSRVDIETDGLEDDIGFLLELDFREQLDSGECIVVDSLRFAIKSDFLTNGQYNYAKDYLTKCNNAIKSGKEKEINKLIDMESLLDMYILQEFAKNFDVGFASLFMYIKEDGGKLYFGPAWDFDLAMGNDDRLNDGGFEKLFAGERVGFGIGHEWFLLLMEQDWFRETVSKRYAELYPIIKNEISELVRYYLANKEQFEKNFERWDIFGVQQLFEPEAVRGLSSHKEHTEHLITWLEGRNEWLLKYFQSEDFLEGDQGLFDKITN